jgi:hypothetical protein
MATVAYFEVDYAPGNYFSCEKQRATISVSTCSAQFKKNKKNKHNCSGSVCVNCEIGAIHAGEKIVYGLPEKMCCRCGRTDQRLIQAKICVSCYNRQREWVIGLNSKGKFPVNARPLYNVNVFNARTGETQINLVTDAAECAMVGLRKSPKAALTFTNPTVPDYFFDQWKL